MSLSQRIAVTVDTPQHAGLQGCLDYVHPQPLPGGTVVRVPLGRRTVTGVVWDSQALTEEPHPALKSIAQVFDGLAPLPESWRSLVSFAASYYQRGLGELALSVLPPEMRKLDATQMARRLARLKGKPVTVATPDPVITEESAPPATDLTLEQSEALQALKSAEPPHTALLYGVTGSGKTEVYLRQAQEVLNAGRQVLMLVPEINLTHSWRPACGSGFRTAVWCRCTAR